MNIYDWRRVTWYAVVNDLIGGYSIALEDKPISTSTLDIAHFMDKEQAEHIANLHNAWLSDLKETEY